MANIAVIETKASRNNYHDYFDFDFDLYPLCSDPTVKKVLKRDCDVVIDIDDYEWVILVGSDSLKHFTKLTKITEYSGKLVEDKFLPVINPAMLGFKPEMRNTWDAAVKSIHEYISGAKVDLVIDSSIAYGIQDTEEAKEYIRQALVHDLPYIALDSETSALYCRDGYILGFSLSYNGLVGVYIDVDCIDEELESMMQTLFTEKTVIFHNAKFDLAFFEYHFNFNFPKFEDTMLLHYLIDENPGTHGLKDLAMKYTIYGDYEKELNDYIASYRKTHGILKANFTYDLIPFDVMQTYAAVDALVTFILYEKFVKILGNKRLAWVYHNILIPGCRFLTDMQENGVPFDLPRLQKGQRLMEKQIEDAVAQVNTHPQISEFEAINGKDFNPNSVVQLRKLLFDYMGLIPTGKKTGTGANSTDAEVLEALASQSEVPGLILNIRQKTKIKNTYLDKIIPQLDRDGRLRTGFNLHTTTSGRLSSSGKLNMQQLPRDNPIVKGCIKAREGYKIVAMDLTTAEVYIAAVLSKDLALQAVFRAGGDFHGAIAHKVFQLNCAPEDVKKLFPLQRQAAKSVSFGIMYGAGAEKISQEITKFSGTFFSKMQAQEAIDDYFEEFHKLRDWIESNKEFIKQNGFIYSHFGRKRRLPNVHSSDRAISGHSLRSGLNFTVQSVASDVNLLGAIDMSFSIKAKNLDAPIFALVHDSVLAEVKEEHVEEYVAELTRCIQIDRGVSIPGCPVNCDFDVHEDYSHGDYEEQYGLAA
jgi:DNA polymerase I-like protein with 3'-5' exonuclease and polymerase domains